MLELKNVSLASAPSPLSAWMERGTVTCLCGGGLSWPSRLLEAAAGLAPVGSGHVTIDGEPVTPASAPYFRRRLSYVARSLPPVAAAVGELCAAVLAPGARRTGGAVRGALAAEWASLGVAPGVWGQPLSALTPESRRLILLGVAAVQRRSLVLVDGLPPGDAPLRLVRRLADGGSCVVCACEGDAPPCDRVIRL